MSLEFSFKYKDYELRACPKCLVRFSPDDQNETIDLLKWYKSGDKSYCYSLAYFEKYSEGYRLKFVGDRPFTDIDKEDLSIIWSVLKQAKEILDQFYEEGLDND